jgi:hypothetical protein
MQVKNVVSWDLTLCGSCKNRRFGGTYRLHLQDGNSELGFFRNVQRTRATRRHIPEDGILDSHRRGNLKSYINAGGRSATGLFTIKSR